MVSKRKNKKKARGKHQRIYIRRSIRRKLQKQWRKLETRASEAKGPFPGGKRVGSWGKKRKKRGASTSGLKSAAHCGQRSAPPSTSSGTGVFLRYACILRKCGESKKTSSKNNRPPPRTLRALLKPYASSNSRTGLPSLNFTVRPIGV